MTTTDRVKHYNYALKSWLINELTFPVVFVLIIWPVAHYLIGEPHSFAKVFSGADLMPLAALLIFGASKELELSSREGEIDLYDLDNIRLILQSSPLLILTGYGFVKYRVLSYTFPAADGNVDPVIFGVAVISILTIIYAGILCYVAKWSLIKQKLKKINGD